MRSLHPSARVGWAKCIAPKIRVWIEPLPLRFCPRTLPRTPNCGSGSNAKRKPSPADRKSTRLNSSHLVISYAVFCLKKKKKKREHTAQELQIVAQTEHTRVIRH